MNFSLKINGINPRVTRTGDGKLTISGSSAGAPSGGGLKKINPKGESDFFCELHVSIIRSYMRVINS